MLNIYRQLIDICDLAFKGKEITLDVKRNQASYERTWSTVSQSSQIKKAIR